MLITFEFGNQGIGLISGELSIALTLGEPHRAARRTEVVVTLPSQEFEESLNLSVVGRWASWLIERHVASVPDRCRADP
jgi:hypothetical protein